MTRTKEIKLFSYPHLPENAEVGFQNDQALGSVCAQPHSLTESEVGYRVLNNEKQTKNGQLSVKPNAKRTKKKLP